MSREQLLRDLWIGVFTVAAGLGYLYFIKSQVSAEDDGADGVSGRSLPYLIGTLLVLLGLLLAGWSWRNARLARPDGSVILTGASLRRVLLYIGVIALYGAGIASVGYIVSTGAALLFAMIFSGTRNRLALVLLTLLVPPLMYWVFHVLMQIPLPETPLF